MSLPDSDNGLDALMLGHFLISRPLEALPDFWFVYQPSSLLHHCQLCQLLFRQSWQHWSDKCLIILPLFAKWHQPDDNLQIDGLVCLCDEGPFLTKWLLALVVAIHPGKDGPIRVITMKMAKSIYEWPMTKAALVLPSDSLVDWPVRILNLL